MGETSKDWNKWAEDIYWSHFQTIHFTQFLLRGYNRQLAIPQKFVDNLKKKLPQSVILKGPSGLTWNVDLTTNDDTLFFNHGWQEFVQDHSLKETDLLVFRYDGGSQFDVLIFDGNNLCEKGASYFVRKREHTEHDTGCIKKKLREGSIDDVLTPSDDGVASPVNSISDGSDGVASPVNSISDDSDDSSDDSDDNETVPSEQFIKSLTANKRTWQNARQCVGSKEPATTGKSIPSDDSDDSDDSSDDSDENETVPSERCIKSLTANKRTWQNARQCVGSKEPATTGKSTPSDDSDDSDDSSDENETVPSERCIKSLTANKRTWQNARQCVGSKEFATTGKSTPK